MKRCFSLLLIYSLCAFDVAAQQLQSSADPGITRVTTAVNHLTVLEFHEPVTMAAAGSSDFQIERQENRVFVKPMRP